MTHRDHHIFAIVPVEAFQDRRLTLEQLRVLGALMTFRGKNTDICWPSREALAERCGYSPPKISETTTALCRLGWLEKAGTGGRGKPTQYHITVPDLIADPMGKTVPESGTVTEPKTVSHSGTLYDRKTVPDSETVPHSGTKRFPNGEPPIRVLRTDQEQTNNSLFVSLRESARARENETEILQEHVDDESQEDGTPAGNTNPGRQGRQQRAPKKTERDKRATRMNEDFVLPADWRQWALEYRPGLDVDRTFEIFRDHFTGSGALKVNWSATWRNWVRREAQFEGRSHGRNKRGDYDAYAGVEFPDFETANIR